MEFDLQAPFGELVRRAGHPRQFVSSEMLEFADGPARGSRVARLYTANGFDIEVLPDRGMDIARATWRGIPLAWLSAVGPVSPVLLESGSQAWRRGFGGGLLTTCGLDQFGDESIDDGIVHPQGGRLHTLVASDAHVWSVTEDSCRVAGFSGEVRQVTPFREDLHLERTIRVPLGQDRIEIFDVVTNLGRLPQPHMILYHMNIGWPIIDETSTLGFKHRNAGSELPAPDPVGLLEGREPPSSEWDSFTGPLDRPSGYIGDLYRHDAPNGAETLVTVESRRLGVRLRVSVSDSLPYVFQWKMLTTGSYVLGIEPANSLGIRGRASARAAQSLPVLEPGESRAYEISISIEVLSAESNSRVAG
jgi:hypothetical protein